MAQALDATATKVGSNNVTWSHTVTTTGSNIVLFVMVMNWVNGGSPANVSGITYNNVALTQVPSAVQDNGGVNPASQVDWWYLINPSTGTNTVSVTMSKGTTVTKCASYSFTGINQTNPIDKNTTNSGTTNSGITNSLTLTAANEYMIDGICHASANTPSAHTGTLVLSDATSGFYAGSQYILQTSSGSQSLGYTFPDAGDAWGLSTIALATASSTTTSTANFFPFFYP